MELKDFLGIHELSGIDEDVDTIYFIIDGISYKAIHDPDDGYRSYMRDLEIYKGYIKNRFPPHKVLGVMRSSDNVIEFYDCFTNKIVLTLGTENSDDYYPYCVMKWNPENLMINVGK